MKFTQIFWDNDGVLVDTERYYLQANREALAKLDITLSDELFVEISLARGTRDPEHTARQAEDGYCYKFCQKPL